MSKNDMCKKKREPRFLLTLFFNFSYPVGSRQDSSLRGAARRRSNLVPLYPTGYEKLKMRVEEISALVFFIKKGGCLPHAPAPSPPIVKPALSGLLLFIPP